MPDPQHSRRDFLRGKAALATAADAIESVVDAAAEAIAGDQASRLGRSESPEIDRERSQVLTLTRRAMACDFDLRLCVSRDQNETEAGLAALDLVERLEDQLTVYRDHSELIDLNRQAADHWVETEPRLFALLQMADRLYTETDGAFDPTGGPLSKIWGFSRREGRVPTQAEIDAARQQVGWHHVQLDPPRNAVRFTKSGVEINVNSIGKGYALDRAIEFLAEQGVGNALMHGGRSTLLARGENSAAGLDGWQAGLRDPVQRDERIAVLTLRNQALSTSGAGTQFFEHEGRRYGHVIDPRTGYPAEGLWSASVIAPTGAEADALSTAAYVLGVEGTQALCNRRSDLAALLVCVESGQSVVHRIASEIDPIADS